MYPEGDSEPRPSCPRPRTGRAIARHTDPEFHRNERGAYKALARAAARVGYDHPIIRECVDSLVKIMRAEPGYSGRYVGARLGAIRELLDRLAGRPRESVPTGSSYSDVDRYLSDLVAGEEDDDEDDAADD